MTEGNPKMNHGGNGKSAQTHRPGRSKDGRTFGGGGTTHPSTPSGSNWKVPSFHAPLIQWSEEASTWYSYGENLPGRNDVLLIPSTSSTHDHREVTKLMTPELIRRYRSIADSIIQNELRLYNTSQSKKSSSDERWVENTMKKGTLKDRIAAMSVTVSNDPIHKFYALDGLMGMVGCSTQSSTTGSSHNGGKPNSRVAQLTAEALEDLFMNTLLPPDRKLVTLAQRPLYKYDHFDDNTTNNEMGDNGNKKKNKKKNSGSTVKTLSPRILLLWRFEEMIKEKYDLYLRQYMAQTLQDGAEQQKTTILQSAARLLSSLPEGESKLLNMMVNKLGDPEKKTAAAAGHQLRVVLQRHPAMQDVVAREVQQLAHRPHLSPKALYNCIAFLNQLHLKRPNNIDPSQNDGDHAKHPLTVPSLPASLIKTYFRLFEVAVQKNNSKHRDKASSSSEEVGTMKSRLLSALLTGVNRAHPYLPEGDRDMRDHVDALFRIVHTAPPAACTQALMLLFQLAVGSQVDTEREEGGAGEGRSDSESDKAGVDRSKVGNERKQQQDRFYRALYATLSKGNIVSGGKHQTMYFNLLYKAMKYDTDMTRVHVFAKRLLAAVMHATPASIAASLFLLQEISKTHQGLRDSWEDVPDPESNAWIVLDDSKREPKAGLVSRYKDGEGNKDISIAKDGTNQTPPGWEIALLAHHVHPSVAKFANDIGDIHYPGDPLQDFALAPLLDKFAYRNPKSQDRASRQQPGRATTTPYHRRMGKLHARLQLPMNDPSFLERTTVNEQEEFFHRFFVERARRDEIKGITRRAGIGEGTKTKEKQDDDDDEGGWDEAEQKAFDDAEKNGGFVGYVGKFEEYEAMWETDEEEEAFVDSLAVQLLEDAAGDPADIDNDPEGMDDWGDIHGDAAAADDDDTADNKGIDGEDRDDDQDDDGSDDDSNSEDGDKVTKSTGRTKRNALDNDENNEDDEDAFMESAGLNEDSDSDDSDMEPELDELDIVGGMAASKFAQEEQDQEDNDGDGQEDNETDDDDDDDVDAAFRMALVNEDSDDDDDDDDDDAEQDDDVSGDFEGEGRTGTRMKRTATKTNEDFPTFAPADDYEEVIQKSFQSLKRGPPVSKEGNEEEVENNPSPKKTQRIEKRHGSNTKRTRRKRKS